MGIHESKIAFISDGKWYSWGTGDGKHGVVCQETKSEPKYTYTGPMQWSDVLYETKDKKYYEMDLSIGLNGIEESQYLIETIQATNSTNLIQKFILNDFENG
jgi:hypothetical protein